MKVLLNVFLTFLGCCSNVVFLELLTSALPGSGNLITLTQFLFISVKGFVFESRFGTRKSKIPLSKYVKLVAMFFVVSVLNNYALNFNISMPLHMIFRSGSLIANMCLGIALLKKRYSMREYCSIVMITVGICLATFASSQQTIKKESTSTSTETDDFIDLMWWSAGIGMLTVALLLSAGMGLIQEKLYAEYGKHPGEALYYNHVLALPAFLLLSRDIGSQVALFNQSESIDLVYVSVPLIWLYLIGNTATQYLCISSVFVLTTECSSLTVTLVLTLRKFTSLIISIIYFKNAFTPLHWIGTLSVFVGTLLFTNIVANAYNSYFENRQQRSTKKLD